MLSQVPQETDSARMIWKQKVFRRVLPWSTTASMKHTYGQKEGLNWNTVFTEASADLIGSMDWGGVSLDFLATFHFLATDGLYSACVLTELLQARPNLWDPVDYSLPGSSIHGISQARILEGLPGPRPGDLSDPGINPCLLHLLQEMGRFFTTSATWEAPDSACLSVCESCSVVSDSLQLHGLYSPWDSPGQNTGVGTLSLLLGIFRTQGSNPGLPHCRQILYKLSHKGSPF